jgi:hypothetical protein
MAGKNHITDEDLEMLHQPKNGAQGKGCLVRHQERTEGHQCSHQWQARVKAEEDSDIYNYPAYKSLCGPGKFKTAARRTSGGAVFPADYAELINGVFKKDRPTHEGKEWDLGKGQNFNHFIKPYWHNAHHIIPNGALKNSINETSDDDERLPNMIRCGLLKATYNLNDKINMIILPQGKVVAEALGLPRHLKGDEVGPDEKGEFYSHADYSRNIESKLVKIMNQYKKVLASAIDESHPKPPDALSKAKLEKLSKDIYKAMKEISPLDAGKALSEIDF